MWDRGVSHLQAGFPHHIVWCQNVPRGRNIGECQVGIPTIANFFLITPAVLTGVPAE